MPGLMVSWALALMQTIRQFVRHICKEYGPIRQIRTRKILRKCVIAYNCLSYRPGIPLHYELF